MKVSNGIKREFEALIQDAYRISADIGIKIEQVMQEGKEQPLSRDEAYQLLTKVITVLKRSISQNGSKAARKTLEENINKLVERVVQTRGQVFSNGSNPSAQPKRVVLEARDGIPLGAVLPTPWFHGRKIPMECGSIKTTDIQLWESNDRLDIHLSQFQQVHGRRPNPEELLAIMLSEMRLPGVPIEDQFKIEDLANSIAINGVRKAPILDIDGTLLDGNRRVAACWYILNSNKFNSEQKRRVEYLFVWQLTKHATNDDRRAVVVSLNFEPDCKQDWPDYVRAKKVFEEWQTMLAIEPRTPGTERMREMKRELSQKFALGTDATIVNRFLRMVDWANEFEEYHINEKEVDTYEAKHRARKYFQYFDELSKGTSPGGVAHTLNQDDSFKHLVFDLLFQGKFKNWILIRKLKFYDQDVRDSLVRARDTKDLDEADEIIDTTLTSAANRKRESRVTGANQRIEIFVKFLEDLPLSSFTKEIRPENIQRLYKALRLVEGIIEKAGIKI